MGSLPDRCSRRQVSGWRPRAWRPSTPWLRVCLALCWGLMLRTSLTSSLATFYRVMGPWKSEKGANRTERSSLKANDLSCVALPFSDLGSRTLLWIKKNSVVTASTLSQVSASRLYGLQGKQATFSLLPGMWCAASLDCRHHLCEPDMKLVWPSAKLLQAAAGASARACDHITSNVLPLLLEQFHKHSQVRERSLLRKQWDPC